MRILLAAVLLSGCATTGPSVNSELAAQAEQRKARLDEWQRIIDEADKAAAEAIAASGAAVEEAKATGCLEPPPNEDEARRCLALSEAIKGNVKAFRISAETRRRARLALDDEMRRWDAERASRPRTVYVQQPAAAPATGGCYSDSGCAYGYRCVKQMPDPTGLPPMTGVCMSK